MAATPLQMPSCSAFPRPLLLLGSIVDSLCACRQAARRGSHRTLFPKGSPCPAAPSGLLASSPRVESCESAGCRCTLHVISRRPSAAAARFSASARISSSGRRPRALPCLVFLGVSSRAALVTAQHSTAPHRTFASVRPVRTTSPPLSPCSTCRLRRVKGTGAVQYAMPAPATADRKVLPAAALCLAFTR